MLVASIGDSVQRGFTVFFAWVPALLGAMPALLLALVPALPLFLAMRWLRMRRRGEVPVDVY